MTINEAASTRTMGLSRSIDNSVAMMNAYMATMDALTGWAKSEHEADGRTLINWVANNTGAIGDSAPEGSILYLDFIRAMEAASFQFSSETDFIVTATLERPGREPVRSTRAFHYSVYSGGAPSAEQLRNTVTY